MLAGHGARQAAHSWAAARQARARDSGASSSADFARRLTRRLDQREAREYSTLVDSNGGGTLCSPEAGVGEGRGAPPAGGRCLLRVWSGRKPSAWGSVSGPLKPSSHAGLGLDMPNPALTSGANFGFACRRSFVPVRTPRSVTRTLPCDIAESHDFSPPPSPATAVSTTFRSFARWVDARAGCEMATTPSPL